jgi:hypothetical protein
MHDAVVLGVVRFRTLRWTTNAIPSIGCRAARPATRWNPQRPYRLQHRFGQRTLENIVGSSHGVRRTITKSVARDPFCSRPSFRETIGKEEFFLGGRTRARTWDPLIKSQLLYQLSYAPGSDPETATARGRRLAKRPSDVQQACGLFAGNRRPGNYRKMHRIPAIRAAPGANRRWEDG